MNSSRTFKNFFLTRIPLFVLLFIFSFSASFVAFNFRFALKDDEKIQVFSTTYGVLDDYSSDLQKDLANEGVLDVFLYDYHPATRNLYTYFTSHGAKSDFHILNLQTLQEMEDVVDDHYLKLDEQVINELNLDLLRDYEFYEYESATYGFALYKHLDVNYNNKFSYEEAYKFKDDTNQGHDFYLLINKNSVNIKGYNDKATTKNAFSALNWLLARFNNA